MNTISKQVAVWALNNRALLHEIRKKLADGADSLTIENLLRDSFCAFVAGEDPDTLIYAHAFGDIDFKAVTQAVLDGARLWNG